MTMLDSIKKYFKPSAREEPPPTTGKRKRDALMEVFNECSPPPGARLLDCVLIPQKSQTALSSPPSAPNKARVKAVPKMKARKQATKPTKTPTAASAQVQPKHTNRTLPTVRKSGRAARRSYVFTSPPLIEVSDEEMEEAASDSEDFNESEAEEEDDDQLSESDHQVTDSDSVQLDGPENNNELDEPELSDEDIEIIVEPAIKKRKLNSSASQATKSKPRISKRDLDLNLPPLTDIQDIFLDITKKALDNGLDQAIDFLKDGKLKVGTMCSGTESPLLALRLVQQCLRDDLNSGNLNVEHIFSAEIEAFKQAYIERNFHPNLLFRDITELYVDDDKQMKGITAYGAEVDVPRDIHVLIAGSSCVDFSTLNTAQVNGFGERKGESEDTFMAVLRYTEWARPQIVILENVEKDEAWTEFKRHFDRIGYATEVVKVDTKDFYLPQTRVRKYMLCLDTKVYKNAKTQELAKWRELMAAFRRRASSSLPTFLLSADDPRQITLLARSQGSSRDVGGSNTSWEACRGRHLAVRLEDRLGLRKPVMMILPEHCDIRWIRRRVDRETDVIEICHLKRAQLDLIDSRFKTRVIDLSQNIERVDNAPLGISGCLTPSGIPYLTDRAGPLTGLHALQLQGIPIDELIFTSETDAELRDLAGNAMSSTIVGSAILGALIVAAKKLPVKRSLTPTLSSAATLTAEIASTGELRKFNQNSVTTISIPAELLRDAQNSSRKCPCEAQTLISNHDIQVCRSCEHTACRKCAGNPKHDYSSLIKRSTRLTPHEFVSRWRSNFPLRIRLDAPVKDLEELEATMDKDVSRQYLIAVKKAAEEQLVFYGFHRGEHWHICYESAYARLELRLLEKPEWILFVKPSPMLPANSKLRRLLGRPIARSTSEVTSDKDSFQLAWWIPSTRQTKVSISGQGSQPSWRATLGLSDYADETVCKILDIGVKNKSTLHSDLCGQYKLLPDCGTAYNSLYRRTLDKFSTPRHDMFFFMDPDPIGIQADDHFVFSDNHERQPNPTYTREVFATAASEWRPWEQFENNPRSIPVYEHGFWTDPKEARLEISGGDIDYHRLNERQRVPHKNSCLKAQKVLTVRFDAPSTTLTSWRGVRSVAMNDRYFYSHLAWPLRDGSLLDNLADWMSVEVDLSLGCETCSPAPPALRWRQDLARTTKKDPRTTIKLVVQEDRLAAASYERLLKDRPLPYCLLTNIDAMGLAEIQVGVNNLSLAHRALAKLKLATSTEPLVKWRLDSNFVERAVMKFPRFHLRSNKNDPTHYQIDGMKLDLRPEQLRSLTWMRAQELGVSFECQEIEEAVHPKLGWKTEVRATAGIQIKGGVLADQPSYGKTVTSLALIHAGFADQSQANRPSITKGLVNLQATLIVTPPHLIKQWRDETTKFLPNGYNLPGTVLVISTQAEWKKYSMLQFLRAKIIILSWKVLLHEAYVGQLALFTALPHPNPGGREFKTWLEYASTSIPDAISSLREAKDIPTFAKDREQQFKTNCEDARFKAAVPSRRVKGAKYAASGNKSKKALPFDMDKIELERPRGDLKNASGTTSAGWQGLAYPPFHLFHFDRLLVDEYALLADKLSGSERTAAYASVMQLKADKRWILSGTPALDDFVDVKAIAGLLGVHLGIDAFVPDLLGEKKLKSLREDLSRSELFQSFQELHSSDWHLHRHKHAQNFLDTFVRQNDAEIGHIETLDILKPVRLVPAHRAVYEELSQYLQAADMSIRESVNHGSDREEKINQSIKEARDAEDALLRSAAAFSSSGDTDSFDDLISLRQGQLESLKLDIRSLLQLAQHLKQHKNVEAKERFLKWSTEPVDDVEAKALIIQYIADARRERVSDRQAAAVLRRLLSPAKHADEPDVFFKIKSSEDALLKMKDTILKLRPHARELTSRTRSLRFVQAIRLLQDSLDSFTCDKCQTVVSLSKLRLVSTCGHTTCLSCLEDSLSANNCLIDGCEAELDQRCVKSVEDYLDSDHRPMGRSFGAKLDNIAELLNCLPPEDQAILFVPGDGLMSDAADCFEHHDIPYVAIYEDEQDLLNKIEGFKETSGKEQDKVLIMNLNGDHATGLNLTNANHIIFLSPLHAQNQYGYKSKMLQAIRRAHRFGQEKVVHVYRFVALKTIDVNIIENRERSLVRPICEDPNLAERLSTVHCIEGKIELSKLVKVDDKLALAPRSWVEKTKMNIAAKEFTADVQLSSCYEELDEEDAVDE